MARQTVSVFVGVCIIALMPHARLLYASPDGTLLEHPSLRPAGLTFSGPGPTQQWRPLPRGATLCQLPACTAQGIDANGRVRTLTPDRELAVGALLPTGHARLMLPAYRKSEGAAYLPLFGFTAVAMIDGEICAASTPIDAPGSWDPCDYSTSELRTLVDARLAAGDGNPLIDQLALCALEYGCYTAQNIFYERWEGALPSSQTCSIRRGLYFRAVGLGAVAADALACRADAGANGRARRDASQRWTRPHD